MPLKRVFLYDDVNDPLQVRGILLELHDQRKMIDNNLSHDLNPGAGGAPSDTWGGILNFPSGKLPVHILVRDDTYRYSGNAVEFLNGDLSDDVYIDLLQLPSGPGGGDGPPESGTPPDINAWIERSPDWSDHEKAAVRRFLFNYAQIIGPLVGDLSLHPDLAKVADNWDEAAVRIGIPRMLLSPSRKREAEEGAPKIVAGAW